MVIRLPHSDYINIWFSRRLEETEVTVGKPLVQGRTNSAKTSKQTKTKELPIRNGLKLFEDEFRCRFHEL